MTRFRYHKDGTLPQHGEVFVFGSNLSGVHGAGAALVAVRDFGAQWGIGVGRTGHAYAIATKDSPYDRLPLLQVRQYVERFLRHAYKHPETGFFVTRIGCGLAGHDDRTMANMFALATPNCSFAEEWAPYLEDSRV